MLPIMNYAPPILVERLYQLTIQKVWEIITDQKYLAQWLMPGTFKAEQGHSYYFECAPSGDDCDDRVFGEVLKVDKPHSITFTWKTDKLEEETEVCFLLEETANGVLFKIEHTGFAAKSTDHFKSHLKGWAHHQDLIQKNLAHEEA